jgi:hypothetical protein
LPEDGDFRDVDLAVDNEGIQSVEG